MSIADRYALSEFRGFRQKLIPTTDTSQWTLASLIRLSEFPLGARSPDKPQQKVALPFQVTIATSTASNVGRILLDVDLELRRSTALQSRDTTSPTRDSQLVELVSMQSNDALQMELAVSGELHLTLTSRPIDFLITLDWVWDNRYARSRVRSPLITHDPTERWAGIISSATACADRGRSAITTMAVDYDGSTTFAFRTVGAQA